MTQMVCDEAHGERWWVMQLKDKKPNWAELQVSNQQIAAEQIQGQKSWFTCGAETLEFMPDHGRFIF